MADYIKGNILCQAYVHIEPANLTAEQLEVIKKQMASFLETRGRFFLYEGVDTQVETKDGSVKKYLTIGGCIYIFLHQYADFREGVTLFYQDARRLSESLVSESLFLTKSKHTEIVHTEARTGVLGSLKDIVDDLNYLEHNIGSAQPQHILSRIKSSKDKTERILKKLKDQRDIDLVSEEITKIVSSFPENPKNPQPPSKPYPSQFLSTYRKNREDYLEILKKKKK